MEKDSKQKSLTKAELHLMNILWDKGQASVGQLHDELENEKTPYTTTLSVMQVLTKKGIVTFEKVGKANIYKPILTREEYIQSFVTEARDNVFGGSMRSLFSFFVRNEKLSKEEIREILKEMSDE